MLMVQLLNLETSPCEDLFGQEVDGEREGRELVVNGDENVVTDDENNTKDENILATITFPPVKPKQR